MNYGDGKENPRLFMLVLLVIAIAAGVVALGKLFCPLVTDKLLFIVVGIVLLGVGMWGVTSGKVLGRGEWYVRSERPVAYWLNVLTFIGAGIAVVVLGIRY